MGDQQLVISKTRSDTRIALLEGGRVAEFFCERTSSRPVVGNIYAGIISRILPGINSAFVDVGLPRSAFLYAGDLLPEQELATLREGQRILVQVVKDPLGNKGARVTCQAALPGHFLVLTPFRDRAALSRRITCPEAKQRLQAALGPLPHGVIARTAAVDAADRDLLREFAILQERWQDIEARSRTASPPQLLFGDLNLIERVTRDLYSRSITRVIVDDPEVYRELRPFLAQNVPDALTKLELYRDSTPLFDAFEIEVDIARALGKRVDLPSGGYLIIEQTEALTSMDVNTGRFVGQTSARQTILRTNVEAAAKAVEQLRIRNIGGIIVVDFIDMEDPRDREVVYSALQDALSGDRMRTNVLRISEMGLVQMTRKRTTESLEQQMMSPCGHCDGRGRVRSVLTESLDLLKEIERYHLQTGETQVRVHLRDDIEAYLRRHERASLEHLQEEYGLTVTFLTQSPSAADLRRSPYEIIWEGVGDQPSVPQEREWRAPAASPPQA